ncbi:MAG: Flp pilus assembly protein TadG [Acidimicrobiales bacterium]|jgi:Flp pilus assembly protein TadG
MRRRGERGQSTVEFALIVPLVIVVMLAVIQVALVAYAQLNISHIARETARAVAADPSVDIGRLMQDAIPLGTEGVVIEVLFEPSPVSGRLFVVVTVSYQTASVSRLFEPFNNQFWVFTEVKMLSES